MARKYIATALHKAMDLSEDPVLLQMEKLPHFVFDHSLIVLFGRSDVKSCIAAVKAAGIARLPVPELLVEWEADGTRFFVSLRESEGQFVAMVARLHPGGYLMTITESPVWVRIEDDGVTRATLCPAPIDGYAAALAVELALMMTVTRGIAKEVIQPSVLNRKREGRGERRIPTHSLVHVGSVYDLYDVASDVPLDQGKAPRAPAEMHIRIGHVRNQAHGEAWSERRVVFIPPTIVNYVPGATLKDARPPRKRVVY